ncbi:MAG: adenine glycosylase [Coriobacteriaceae bacterium]|jgi:A/G-specific adenine glycosylase|nr:adenine glycosylase [Coriobacteriaceae bacterium]
MPDHESFIARVWESGRRYHRDLPWRDIDDPYAVLVSEVMLQQTQVSRVMGYWAPFLAAFPTLDALAAADAAVVLERWQGLGYNRRALSLKRTAETCSREQGGVLPTSYEGLLALPGIGSATAAGVCAFAYRKPSVYLETNVRAVFIHEFFPEAAQVSDKQIHPLVESTCSQQDPRGWYYALLDYGAFLKQQAANPSRRSVHYTRQSPFQGSRRQKRALLLRQVLAHPGISGDKLKACLDDFEKAAGRCPCDQVLCDEILEGLCKEGFFKKEGEAYSA